jgi:hypothetical protein
MALPQADPESVEAPASPQTAPRIHVGELISAASALILVALTFLLEWYGLAGNPGPTAARAEVSTAENAWQALTLTRWLLLLTILVAIGSVFLHASQRSHGAKTDTGFVITALGSVTAAVLVYRVLIVLPDSGKIIDQKIGAYLGLLAAIGVAYGGFESMREERSRGRRIEHKSRRRNRVARGAAAR